MDATDKFTTTLSEKYIQWRLFSLGLCMLAHVQTQSYHDEMKLRNDLMTDYSSLILPKHDLSEPVDLHFTATIATMHELNEKKQLLKTTTNIELSWINEILTWDPNNYGGIKTVKFEYQKVWTPDIVIENSVSADRFLRSDNMMVKLDYTGQCHWYPSSGLETRCSINISKFPFDTQQCEIVFTAWMNPSSRLRIFPRDINETKQLQNGEWELTDQSVARIVDKMELEFHTIKYTFTLKRRVAYYIINTIVPVLLLSLLNVLVFIIPAEAGEKMSLSITVVLAYSVFLTVVNESMPSISTSVSILEIYVLVVLVTGTGCAFVSAINLNYYYGMDGRVRNFIPWNISKETTTRPQLTAFISHDTDSSSPQTKESDKGVDENKSVDSSTKLEDFYQRQKQIDKIDVLAFRVILSLIVLFTIVCFVMLML